MIQEPLTTIFIIGSIILVIFFILLKFFYRLAYTRNRFMTESEFIFYQALKSAVGNAYDIFAQVRLASLVKPRGYFIWNNFQPLAIRTVDFVLANKTTGYPLLVIELDDPSHLLPKRQHRDKFIDRVLSQINLPILHIKRQDHYNPSDLLNQISPFILKSLP